MLTSNATDRQILVLGQDDRSGRSIRLAPFYLRMVMSRPQHCIPDAPHHLGSEVGTEHHHRANSAANVPPLAVAALRGWQQLWLALAQRQLAKDLPSASVSRELRRPLELI